MRFIVCSSNYQSSIARGCKGDGNEDREGSDGGSIPSRLGIGERRRGRQGERARGKWEKRYEERMRS